MKAGLRLATIVAAATLHFSGCALPPAVVTPPPPREHPAQLPPELLAPGGINVSVTALHDFGDVTAGQSSDLRFYEVSASGLSRDLTVSAGDPFQISLNYRDGYRDFIVLSPEDGELPLTRIFVRFLPRDAGKKQGTIRHASPGFAPQAVSVSGSATLAEIAEINVSVAALPDFREVRPGQFSDVQFYKVSASGLSQDLTVSADGPFKISLDCRDDYRDVIALSPEGKRLPPTRIFVRFFPQDIGEKQGTIRHESPGFSPRVVAVSGVGSADSIPPGYYSAATGAGRELKTRLHEIIANHQTQTYGSLWAHFTQTDATFSGHVWDIYSDIPCGEPPYLFTFDEHQDRGTGGNREGTFYNREHSMPRSWFGGERDPMHTDLFHIYPVDKFVNAKRGDHVFGEVPAPSWTSMNGGRIGNNAGEYTGVVFEPIDAFKGDLARTYFYMVTCYEDQIETWTSNAQGNAVFDHNRYPGFKPWVIEMLGRWHHDDPVSQKEILRNDAVYRIQGNRNPFIDHPEFVEMIWGD